LDDIIVPLLIFAFALVYYTTSLQKNCWYRRYMLPALFIIFAFLYSTNFVLSILLFIAAILVYYSSKGYGKKALKEKEIKEDKKSEEKKNRIAIG